MEGGWSLTETLVAICIVAILATIGLPLFQGQRASASNSAAQANLSSVYRSATEIGSDGWPAATQLVAELGQAEPAFSYHPSTSASTGPTDVSVQVSDADMLTLCVQSKTRLFYCLRTDRLGQIDTDTMAMRPDRGGLADWLVPSASAEEDPTNGEGDAAHSTGATETAARRALPTRNTDGSIANNNARGWTDCVGACALRSND